MENKTLKLLMIKWLNYAYCLSEEPQDVIVSNS